MALNDQKILDSIKSLLGIEIDDNSFDVEIIVHINSAFSTLHQLGVGPASAFAIDTGNEIWAEFINDVTTINSVKALVYYEVRLAFDPPATSYGISAFERMRDELKWRLMVDRDPGILVSEVPDPLDI